MIKAVIFDFSRVILFPLDKTYKGSLNELHKVHLKEKGYSVFNYFSLNIELLQQIEKIMHKAGVYILTSETIQESPEFNPYLHQFKKIYSALRIGFSKKDSQLFKWILKDLQLEPYEILYIDDSVENINAALKAGLETIQYKGNELLLDQLTNYSLL